MQVSEARLAANRLNSLRSKGPTSEAGKRISRMNACTHLLTGAGIIAPESDVDEIQVRVEALTAEMSPKTAAGAILIGKMATLSVRMERAAEQESAHIAMKVRHAANDFDDEQTDAADALFETLADDPRKVFQKLIRTPEGVEKLVEAWDDLKADLASEADASWTDEQLEQAANLTGMKSRHARSSRLGALNRAIRGDFAKLSTDDGAGLKDDARKAWAKARLSEAIDAEVAALEAHYETLDFETYALDRAGAAHRALFDASKPATLARRYESEASRGFFKALKEFRQVEAEFEASTEAVMTPPAPSPTTPRMGSFRAMTPPPPIAPSHAYSYANPADEVSKIDDDGVLLAYVPPVKKPD